MKMNFKEELQERVSYVESVIGEYIPKAEGFQKTVIEAMNYSILAGGKRIRPLLMSEVYRMCGGTSEIIKPFMAAIEQLHTYSLVHDDLPAMDNDELRRGRPTTHVQYGEAMAILAGDGLLNYAYETAISAFELCRNEDEVKRVTKALKVFAFKSGIYGMVGGQTVDIESVSEKMDMAKLDFIYRLKTGALIEASFMIGAILAGASEKAVKDFNTIASKVGLAFQIKDDILDVTSTSEVLGKPILSDAKNDKTTYVTIEGLGKAKLDVNKLSEDAIHTLHSVCEEDGITENPFLESVINMLINREK